MARKSNLKKADDEEIEISGNVKADGPPEADNADQGTTRDLDPVPVEIPMADNEVKEKPVDDEQEIKGDAKDEDEPKDGDKSEKSTASMLNDLRKAVDELSGQISLKDRPARKQALLAKAQVSDLSPVEFEELSAYLQNRETRKSLREDVTKSFANGEPMRKSLDASNFLTGLTSDLKKSMGDVCDYVQGMSQSHEELSLALAKSIVGLSQVVQSIATDNDALQQQVSKALGMPAHAPRSQGVAPQYTQKSFANTPSSETLTKGQIEAALTDMFEKSKGGVYEGVNVQDALYKSGFNKPLPQTALALVQKHLSESQN